MIDLSELYVQFQNDNAFVGLFVGYLQHLGLLDRNRPDNEYGISFKINHGEPAWRSVLSHIEAAHVRSERFCIEPFQEESASDVTFFDAEEEEISRFVRHGFDMVKKVRHRCELRRSLYIYINHVKLITDRAGLDVVASENHLLPSASMQEKRITNYSLDWNTGACYALTARRCEAASARQFRLGIDYYGCVSGTTAVDWTEDQLLESLVDVATSITEPFPGLFTSTALRDMTFALNAT